MFCVVRIVPGAISVIRGPCGFAGPVDSRLKRYSKMLVSPFYWNEINASLIRSHASNALGLLGLCGLVTVRRINYLHN